MQRHISEIKGRNTKRSRRTRVRNWKATATLPCLCFSLWFFYILILSTTWFLGLSGSQGGMYSLPSSLHDFQLYLACCILVLRITGRLSLLIPHTHKRETSLVAQMVKSRLQCRRPRFEPWVRKIPWRRKWQSTPVFLPGESHGQKSLVSPSPLGCKELDITEQLTFLTWKWSWLAHPGSGDLPWSSQPWSRSSINMANSERPVTEHISQIVS